MIKAVQIFTFLVFVSSNCISQENDLPRRSFLGVRSDSLTRDLKQQLKITEGVRILSIVPNSTASAAGLLPSDILLSLNKKNVSSPLALATMAREIKLGEELQFQILRNGKKLTVKTTMRHFPKENYADLTVEYDHVGVKGARLRTIVTKPKSGGNNSAILYIQGISCGSIDTPLDTAHTQTQLINHLARAGYTVMRVDKAGTGDSEGGPCSNLDFLTEGEGYRAALTKLKSTGAKEIYLVGHSMGGVWAPWLAKQSPVKGIIAYGTIGTNYAEYIANSRRTVAQAIGLTPEQTDAYVKEFIKCFGLYHALNLNASEAQKICPDCEDELQLTTIRSREFQKQLYDLNIPGLWQEYDGNVLCLWGTSDFISVEGDHKLIATIVNEVKKGKAVYVPISDADHGMATAYSFGQAARNPGGFNKEVASAMIGWLQGKTLAITTIKTEDGIPFPKDPSVKEILRTYQVENAYPRWGANNKIIFQSNRDGRWQIYSMNEDGSQQMNLSRSSSNDNFVSTSADGKLIGFVSDRDGNEEIYVMNADGSNPRRLTDHSARDIHPYFSPDGTRVLFNSNRANSNNFDVYSVDVTGGNLKRLTNTPDEETCARLSPDQKKIVMLTGVLSIMNDEVQIMNPDGSNIINVTKSVEAEGWPVWSHDGKKIYYASQPARTFRIYEINADGTGRKEITSVSPPFMDARPEISADGKRMLFNRQVTERSGKNTIAIYLKELH